jgi:hypothetical protein
MAGGEAGMSPEAPVPQFRIGEIWADKEGDGWTVIAVGEGRAQLRHGEHVLIDGERLHRMWGPLTLVQGAIA